MHRFSRHLDHVIKHRWRRLTLSLSARVNFDTPGFPAEALAHGTWAWSAPTERRTVFLKYVRWPAAAQQPAQLLSKPLKSLPAHAQSPLAAAHITDYPVPEWLPQEQAASLNPTVREILRAPGADGGSHMREASRKAAAGHKL